MRSISVVGALLMSGAAAYTVMQWMIEAPAITVEVLSAERSAIRPTLSPPVQSGRLMLASATKDCTAPKQSLYQPWLANTGVLPGTRSSFTQEPQRGIY